MTSDVNVVISHSEYTVLVVDDVVSNVLLLKVLLTNEKFKDKARLIFCSSAAAGSGGFFFANNVMGFTLTFSW